MDRWLTPRSRYRGKILAQFDRPSKAGGKISGFIIDFSPSFILLNRFDWDNFALNGFTVVRENDIKAQRFFSSRTHWQNRAVAALGLRPELLKDIELDSWDSIITSAARHFPLVTIHLEITKPEVCYIGVPIQTTAETLTLDDLNSNAEWTGPRRIRLDQITRIDFGGGYENALAAIAPKRKLLR